MRPGACCAGPSPPVVPSCRTRPGRRQVPAPAPGPHPGVPSAAVAAPGPAVTRARAAWWRAGRPVAGPPPPTQPLLSCTLCASAILRRRDLSRVARFPAGQPWSGHSMALTGTVSHFPEILGRKQRRPRGTLVPLAARKIPPDRHLWVAPWRVLLHSVQIT
jgi:hypothetical protein